MNEIGSMFPEIAHCGNINVRLMNISSVNEPDDWDERNPFIRQSVTFKGVAHFRKKFLGISSMNLSFMTSKDGKLTQPS